MKKLLAILFFCSIGVSAQTILKKDGTKIDVSEGTIHVEPGNKRLTYFLKDSKEEMHVKFKELDQASWGDFVFKTFLIDGKEKGFYVITTAADKTLVSTKRTRIKSRGGFESTYIHYDVAVLKQSQILEALSFTDVNSDKQTSDRSKVIPMIKKHFSDCQKLIERVTAFESPPTETMNTTILVFLNDPVYVKCE